MFSWLFWLTGAVWWGYVAVAVLHRFVLCGIFAYRMGFRNAKSFSLATWFDWYLSPPDRVGPWYWPSKGGVSMRKYDEGEV